MNVGALVEHKDKVSKSGYPHDKRYWYMGDVRCKDRHTGFWYDAVEYQEENDESKVFVRERYDFERNFKEVENGAE